MQNFPQPVHLARVPYLRVLLIEKMNRVARAFRPCLNKCNKKSVTFPEQKHKKIKHYDTPGHAHELTFSCYHRYDHFSNSAACKLFLSELERSRKEDDFELWAYVLMPNHVHLLMRERKISV
jgi:hypothetical protein